MSDLFGDQYVCEKCGAFIRAEETEQYQEKHGRDYESLMRTSCCGSSYQDLSPQLVIDELKSIQESMAPIQPEFASNGKPAMRAKALSQIQRDNLEQIEIILEGVFEL